MLDDSPRNRWMIRAIIVLFRLYGPLCLGYTIWAGLAKAWPPLGIEHYDPPRSTLLLSLCISEAAFYLFSLWYACHVQAAAVHPPLRTKDERVRLFDKVCSEVDDFENFLLGWFLGAKHEELGVEELRRWIDWALWEGRAEEVNKLENDDEISEYVSKIEKMMGRPFLDGSGSAKALRLTLDPIAIERRSLAWYCLVMAADTIAILSLQLKGFSYYRRKLADVAAVFPPRPSALYTSKVSPAPSLSYFVREHTSKTRLPVIYIHGIGIGLLPHIDFLDEIHTALNSGADDDEQVGILAVEILQISSRLTTSSIPWSADFVSQMTSIIDHHFGSSRVVLVAHSYGTVLSTAILRDQQLSARISGALFIDPISILLHMPDVAYNFTRRKPVRANEWALWWFGKDPQVAHTLGRHLFWSECVLWRDQMENLIENCNMRLTVSLSSEDLIVNTRAVRDYVVKTKLRSPVNVESVVGEKQTTHQEGKEKNAKAEQWHGVGLEVLWWDGYDHAEVLDARQDRAKLIKVVMKYCSGK